MAAAIQLSMEKVKFLQSKLNEIKLVNEDLNSQLADVKQVNENLKSELKEAKTAN
jgi:FtsZ-binding cell division protein ZapB